MNSEIECMWCGGVCDMPRPYYTRDRAEVFCSAAHRTASARALHRFLSTPRPGRTTAHPPASTIKGPLLVTVHRDRVTVPTLAAASAACRAFIEAEDLGSSEWFGGNVVDAVGVIVARVSYNGRVWAPSGAEFDLNC